MPPANPTVGHAAKLGVGATSPATVGLEFISESLAAKQPHVDWDGIRGHRGHDGEIVVKGQIDVSGNLTIAPTPTILQTLLPWILGGTTTLNETPLAETLPKFVVVVDRGAKVFTYTDCKVDKAVFKSAKGDKPMTLELEIVGVSETIGAAGTFPALTIPLEQPYMHYQAVLTLNAIARNVDDVTITIDNKLDRDQYRNSQTRQVIPETGRLVTVEVNTPWTADEVDLLTLGLATAGGTII